MWNPQQFTHSSFLKQIFAYSSPPFQPTILPSFVQSSSTNLPSHSPFLSSCCASCPNLFPPCMSPFPESMILLGSIERAQLQSLLTQQLGRPRRLQYIRERAVMEKKRLSVVSNTGSDDSQRASQEVRFQVREGVCT